MKWRILLNLPSYPIEKQSKIIIAMMALHNFIRESLLYDRDFENYVDDSATASQASMDDVGVQVDDTDMSILRDSISAALM